MRTGGSQNREQALTMIEVWVVVFVIAVLIAIYLPQLTGPKKGRSKRIQCVNNLKQVGLAFRVWAIDRNDTFPWQVPVTNGGTMELVSQGNAFVHFQVLSNELYTPKIVVCPEDSRRTAATNFESDFDNSHVSYFVGLDADPSNPQMLLSGDDNLALGGVRPKPGIVRLATNSPVAWTPDRHGGAGNILLSDGSVQQATSARLRELLRQTGVTNRLAMP